MKYARVLTIAGSDSGGGAGIQADIKAISATRGYAASAITAITVQNTVGVSGVLNLPPDIIQGQIKAVLDDIGADAVKIGMLGNSVTTLAVRDALSHYDISNIVLDPVMVATSGDRLLDEEAVDVLIHELAPLARVLTPNLPEAEILCGRSIASEDEFPEAARLLSELVSTNGHKVSVLMKAGHLHGSIVRDYFYNAEEDRITELDSNRVESPNTHGTGCTLSSAFASYLAQGYSLDDSACKAKDYIAKAIETGAAYTIGHGHGPVNHFWNLK